MATKAALAKAKAGLTLETRYGQFESWSSNSRALVIDTTRNAIVKRFAGESAWSDSARKADDLYTEFRTR